MSSVKAIVCSFSNLHRAMCECKKGVMWKDSPARYVNNGLASTYKLEKKAKDGTNKIETYFIFTIYEPKEREIVSTRFKDRIIQRSLCDNYLYETITKNFIYDNGACQNGRGTDFSRNRLKAFLHKYYYKHGNVGFVLKVDYKNYFGSTPHSVAKRALRKVVKDEWALNESYKIIDSYDNGDAIGMGLGSQITQLVQLLVLSDLDHHIKEELKIKHYLRYMDDLIIIHPDKQYLYKCLDQIRYMSDQLGLTLNSKKTQIFKLSQGINFLGFKHNLSSTGAVFSLLLKDNIKKRKRKLRKFKKLVDEGKMSQETFDESYESWKAHASKGNSYKVIKKMDLYYNQL